VGRIYVSNGLAHCHTTRAECLGQPFFVLNCREVSRVAAFYDRLVDKQVLGSLCSIGRNGLVAAIFCTLPKGPLRP